MFVHVIMIILLSKAERLHRESTCAARFDVVRHVCVACCMLHFPPRGYALGDPARPTSAMMLNTRIHFFFFPLPFFLEPPFFFLPFFFLELSFSSSHFS